MAQVPGSPWVIVADGLTKKSLDIDSVGQDPLFGYVKIIAKNGALETESDNISVQLFDLTAIPKPLNLTVKENEPGIAHIEWTPIAGSKYQVFKKEAANDISLGIVTVPYFDFTTSLKTTFYVKAIDIKSSLVGLKSNEVSNPMDAANLQNIKASFDGTYLTSSFEINPLFQKYIIKTEMSINSMSWQPYSDKVLVSNSKSPYVVAIKVYYSTGTEKTTSVIAGIGNLNYAFGTLTNSGKFTLFFDGDPGITVKVSDSVETFNLSYSGDSIPKNVNFWGSKIQIEYLLSNISIGKVEVNIPVTGLDICFWQLKKGWNLISVPLLASDFSSKVMTIGNNEISLFQKLNLQIINGVALLNVLKDTILLVEGYYPYAWSNPYSNLSPATVEISPMYEMTIFPKDKEIYTWIGGIVKGRKGENIIPGLTFLQKIIPGYGIVITDFDIINISK